VGQVLAFGMALESHDTSDRPPPRGGRQASYVAPSRDRHRAISVDSITVS